MSIIVTFLLLAAVAHNTGASLHYLEKSYGVPPQTESKKYLINYESTVQVPEIFQNCSDMNGYPAVPETLAELNALITEIESNPSKAGKKFVTSVSEIAGEKLGFIPLSLEMKRFLNPNNILEENVIPSLSAFSKLILEENPNDLSHFRAAFLKPTAFANNPLSLLCEGF